MDKPAPAATAAPAPAPAEPMTEPADDAGFGDFGGDEAAAPASDTPFDKEPFDAGVEADEETDPKKFIEQLSGKLGQSLRSYTDESGQPDFDLEKFAINSVISATHTSEMDENDRKDIIKKINSAGKDDAQDSGSDNQDNTDFGDDTQSGPDDGAASNDDFDFSSDEEDLGENSYQIYENEDFFLENPKRMSIFAPEDSPEFMEENRLTEACWKGYKQVGMKEKNGKEVPNCVPVNEESEGLWANIRAKKERGESPAKPGDEDYPDKKQWNKLTKEGEGESNNYMFWQNLKTIHHASGELLHMSQEEVDAMIANGHAWAVDHIATSSDDIEEVYHFMEANLEGEDYDGETEGGYKDEYGSVEHMMSEGKYDGKPLGKPMKGDVKKFKVYVRNKKGNVIKVNFGDPNMEIKRDNPERRKSFRARHKCSQAKDRTTPKYWSCKMWSKKPVSKMVEENLINPEKSSIFDKATLLNKLHESLNQNNMNNAEPQTLPAGPKTKPAETQPVQPTRRQKTFLPEIETQPDPKANK